MGSIFSFGSGQRTSALVTYARMAAMSMGGAAWAESGSAAASAAKTSGFMSLRINGPIPLFNPSFQAAVDVYDVAEAGHGEQLRRQRAVGGVVAVHEHGHVLVGKELGQLAFDRIERRAERTGDVPLRPAVTLRRADVEDDHLA